MTTFKEIRGTTIESVSTDPTNPEVGQIWYNNTIGVLKGYKSIGATWASGGNMGTARAVLAGAGTQTAGLAFAGGIGTPPFNTDATESYNGSAWTAGGNMGTARGELGGAGTQTAGLGFGGYIPGGNVTFTEEFNSPGFTTKTLTVT